MLTRHTLTSSYPTAAVCEETTHFTSILPKLLACYLWPVTHYLPFPNSTAAHSKRVSLQANATAILLSAFNTLVISKLPFFGGCKRTLQKSAFMNVSSLQTSQWELCGHCILLSHGQIWHCIVLVLSTVKLPFKQRTIYLPNTEHNQLL